MQFYAIPFIVFTYWSQHIMRRTQSQPLVQWPRTVTSVSNGEPTFSSTLIANLACGGRFDIHRGTMFTAPVSIIRSSVCSQSSLSSPSSPLTAPCSIF